MRDDMDEVIIERPRKGGSGLNLKSRRRALARRALEDAPLREAMSRGRGSKCLNENLAPLWRFLRSRCGRPWDEVYSEIRARLSPRSAVQKHVFDHVRMLVAREVVMRDGPFPSTARYVTRDHDVWGFYVCPETGRLLEAPLPPRRPGRVDPDIRRVDASTEARRIDGIWYLITFASVPASTDELGGCRDVLLRAALGPEHLGPSGPLAERYGRGDRYARSKRQLSTREIARLVTPAERPAATEATTPAGRTFTLVRA